MLWFFWGVSYGRWEYPMVGYVLGLGMKWVGLVGALCTWEMGMSWAGCTYRMGLSQVDVS